VCGEYGACNFRLAEGDLAPPSCGLCRPVEVKWCDGRADRLRRRGIYPQAWNWQGKAAFHAGKDSFRS
jgi:hypothetical protein